MLKQSLKAFKLFQHRFNILSTRFNNVERGWQTLSTLPFNKIERMLKQMLKPFARAFTSQFELNVLQLLIPEKLPCGFALYRRFTTVLMASYCIIKSLHLLHVMQKLSSGPQQTFEVFHDAAIIVAQIT